MEVTNPNRRGIINHREDRGREEGHGILSLRCPVPKSLIFGRISDHGFGGFHGSQTSLCLFVPSVYDYPGAAVVIDAGCTTANVCGNKLLSGGHGLLYIECRFQQRSAVLRPGLIRRPYIQLII
jgi:hypothetical protein